MLFFAENKTVKIPQTKMHSVWGINNYKIFQGAASFTQRTPNKIVEAFAFN